MRLYHNAAISPNGNLKRFPRDSGAKRRLPLYLIGIDRDKTKIVRSGILKSFSISRLKEKLGAIGWAVLLIFLAQRVGDALNLVAGLWLVPKYVPEHDLGSLKVLEQLGAVIGVPVAILATPFTKLLNTHAARGELGKAKALMRDAFIASALALALAALLSALALPLILARWNIGNGRLAMLVIASGALGALLPIFNGAMQAMKRFKTYSVISLISAPVRFATLLVTLPFRGLTGYFAGQSSGSVVVIAAAVWSFFKGFGRGIKREKYWREDRAVFIAFLIPLAIAHVAGALRGTAEMTMIQYLPGNDSAAYYILSRFTDIVGYIIAPLTFVIFPVFSERHETGEDTLKTMIRAMFFCVAVGAALGLALNLFGARLLSLHHLWRPYAEYSGLFALLSVKNGLAFAFSCFALRELASRRFLYAYFTAALAYIETAAIYALGKSPFFASMRLREVLLAHLALPVVFFIYSIAVLAARRRQSQKTLYGQNRI